MLTLFQQVPPIIKGIIFSLLILVGVFFLGRCTAPQSTQDKGGVLTSKVEIKTDTIFYPRYVHDTIRIDKPIPYVVYKNRPIPVLQSNGDSTLLHRVYKGEREVVKDVKIGYNAKVSGILDTLDLLFTDTRPQMVIRDSVKVTNTLTKTKHPTGLYLGFQTTQSLSNYGPTIDLVRPKFSLGLGYDLKQASPQFRVGFNLIRDKQE